jgi:hypothetical protein
MPPRVGQHRSVTIVDSSGKLAHDNLSGYPITIDIFHDKIHQGEAYQETGTNSLGSGGQKLYHIVTANTTTWSHLGLSGLITARGADSNVAIYHSSTVDSIGTGVTLSNMDANTSISHITSVYEDPTTITNTGTLLHKEYVASGNKSGGTNVSREEVILKQNASHLIIFESEGANNNVSHIIRFYESNNI